MQRLLERYSPLNNQLERPTPKHTVHGDDIVHGMTSHVGIFYGGDDNTLVANKGFAKDKAKQIYDNFMKTFQGIKRYQAYCRKVVMEKGYILMNPVFKHRAHIFDAEWMF